MIWGSTYTMIAVFSEKVTFGIAKVIFDIETHRLLQPGASGYQMAIIYIICSALIVIAIIQSKRSRMSLSRGDQISLMIIISMCLIAVDKLLDLSIAMSTIHIKMKVDMLIDGISILIFIIMLYACSTVILPEKAGGRQE